MRALDQRGIRRIAAVDIGAAAYYVWHNLKHDVDVDGDGTVAPRDVVTTIILLNAGGDVSYFPKTPPDARPFYDVDNDGTIAPRDLLLIIIYLNAYGAGEGEGQGTGLGSQSPVPSSQLPVAGSQSGEDWLALLALDISMQPRRRV